MAFLAKLQEISPAYAAYATLKCPPKNCPLFESPDGYPILEPGEIFCRLDGVEGRVCGAKEETTDHLLYHMEAEHEAMRMDRPMEPRRKAEVGELERVDRFYKELMKDENYTTPKRSNTPVIKHIQATPKTPLKRKAPSAELNDVTARSIASPKRLAVQHPPSKANRSAKAALDRKEEARALLRVPQGPSTYTKSSLAASQITTAPPPPLRTLLLPPQKRQKTEYRPEFIRGEASRRQSGDAETQSAVPPSKTLQSPPQRRQKIIMSKHWSHDDEALHPNSNYATKQLAYSPPRTPQAPQNRRDTEPRHEPKQDESLQLQHQRKLQEIQVKEARIKGDLKESQLKEVRIKAELLEIQLVEAQIQQEVQQEKLKQIELEKQLQKTLASIGRMSEKSMGSGEERLSQETVATMGAMNEEANEMSEVRTNVVDLLDGEGDE